MPDARPTYRLMIHLPTDLYLDVARIVRDHGSTMTAVTIDALKMLLEHEREITELDAHLTAEEILRKEA